VGRFASPSLPASGRRRPRSCEFPIPLWELLFLRRSVRSTSRPFRKFHRSAAQGRSNVLEPVRQSTARRSPAAEFEGDELIHQQSSASRGRTVGRDGMDNTAGRDGRKCSTVGPLERGDAALPCRKRHVGLHHPDERVGLLDVVTKVLHGEVRHILFPTDGIQCSGNKGHCVWAN
jgi:hypothetical protein